MLTSFDDGPYVADGQLICAADPLSAHAPFSLAAEGDIHDSDRVQSCPTRAGMRALCVWWLAAAEVSHGRH